MNGCSRVILAIVLIVRNKGHITSSIIKLGWLVDYHSKYINIVGHCFIIKIYLNVEVFVLTAKLVLVSEPAVSKHIVFNEHTTN